MRINSEEEYDLALIELDKIFLCEENDPKFPRMVELCEAVAKYEDVHYAIEEPSEEAMDQYLKEKNDFKKGYLV